jgi:hypothetical protein
VDWLKYVESGVTRGYACRDHVIGLVFVRVKVLSPLAPMLHRTMTNALCIRKSTTLLGSRNILYLFVSFITVLDPSDHNNMSTTSHSFTTTPLPSRRSDPESQSTISPMPQVSAPAPIAIPIGFAGQLRSLQEHQRKQDARIAALEQENAKLSASRTNEPILLARIAALEQHNATLTARRRETVSQLLNLRTLHQDADNTFQLRSQDIHPDDLEGMVAVYASSATTVMNHHQRVLAQMRVQNQQCAPAMYYQPQPPRSMFPMAYTEAGYCHAHNVPYWCRICGQ